ncbi:MAG: guanylate kinase [candidate division WOR-3 bacterium]
MLNNKLLRKGYYKPKIFVLASPSAAGKTTLCYAAVKRDKNIWYSVSATTRAKRPHEKNGREYYFISEEKFQEWEKQGELLETTEIYNAKYGTPKQPLLNKLKRGKDVILDLDLAGVKALKRFYPYTVSIYIIPPSLRTLWQRLKNRSQSSSDKIHDRFQKASAEINYVFEQIEKKKPLIDYVIINNKLETAIADLMAIIRAERLKVL